MLIDLDNKWPGTIVLVIVFSLLLGAICALCAHLIDPALPLDVRKGAVTIWAVTTIIAGIATMIVRHEEASS